MLYLELIDKMAGQVIGLPKDTTLSEEAINVITYWFGTNYWIKSHVSQNFNLML